MIFETRRLTTALLIFAAIGAAPAQRFYPDDPLTRDPDQLPIDEPEEKDRSQILDFMENTFLRRPEGPVPAAENINTLGEVPDSSWYVNRIRRLALSLDELARGPNRGTGPDLSRPLRIVAAKTEGITPGFTVRDARDNLYFIKFDPLDHPQLSTSTEVIATKFFHAFGYNVPENYLTFIRPEMLAVDTEATIRQPRGRERRMTEEDVAAVLRRAPRRADGSAQAVASLALEGTPLGPFSYFGMRSDDPNDVFPHENRRELRGLRVFAAWLNHDDTRSINSLDTFVRQGGKGYVRHHLIDFGSCLGSGSVKPQSRRAGNEYMLEWDPIVRAAVTLGIWDRPWRHVKYPDLPGVGRFESDYFQPQLWKPEYPNPAFERMLPDDAYWAARIVSRFTDEMIAAIVKTGRLDDPRSERHVTRALIERRNKIVRHYFSPLNPLADFSVAQGRLDFINEGARAGLATSPRYRWEWFEFNNKTLAESPLGVQGESDAASIPIPQLDRSWLLVRIRTVDLAWPQWANPLEVYLRTRPQLQVVGVHRTF